MPPNTSTKSLSVGGDTRWRTSPTEIGGSGGGTFDDMSHGADAKHWLRLTGDRWRGNDGHLPAFVGIFLFTLVLYFRPYELIPALSGFQSIAFVIAVATLLVYLPSQLALDGRLTILTTEVKCVLFIAISAAVTIPLAKDPALAWAIYSDTFVKVVVIFIIAVNVLRTKARVMALMGLAIAVGVYLSYQAIQLYQAGVFNTEGYRVSVDFGGMFGNPNDMSIHLVVFLPIAVVLGLASKNKLTKLVLFLSAGMMVVGNVVTQSRGGFLGLLPVFAILVWKLGRNSRVKTLLIASAVVILFMSVAPGNYGKRMLSIFVPGLDPVGSHDQRREALERSLVVTLRNPLGIGIGNSPVVGVKDHQTHNAFTQVSSELGWLPFVAYVVLLISPFRKLRSIERATNSDDRNSWLFYTSVGLQASIAGYMVSSFFGSVAYQWYIYYPIAFAVSLRRIYCQENAEMEEIPRVAAIALSPERSTA